MTITEVYHQAIHSQVLVVYVVKMVSPPPKSGWRGDWRAYVVPVPGEDHQTEKERWRKHGERIGQAKARMLAPHIVYNFD